MRFVLVTGCPRSGTTAVGQWLGSQPGVLGVTESRRTIAMHAMLREARRFACFHPPYYGGRTTKMEAARAAARRAALMMYGVGRGTTDEADEADEPLVLVDKEPLEPVALPGEGYSEYLQDVVETLDARLVCMVRNPVDTVSSMMLRKWGHSLHEGEPLEMAIGHCIETWRKATRAVLRMSVVEPSVTHLLSFEHLCTSSLVATEEVGRHLEMKLSAFVPKQAGKGSPSQVVYEQTQWERRLLSCYDERLKTKPAIVLLTGEPGVGKSTISGRVGKLSDRLGGRVVVLDGDELRRRLWPELGYGAQDRTESVKRATRLAVSVAQAGAVVVIAMVAPASAARQGAKESVVAAGVPWAVVRVTAPIEVRTRRRVEDVHDFVYDEPSSPDLTIDTSVTDVEESATSVLRLISCMMEAS